jgi:hypothetical protein
MGNAQRTHQLKDVVNSPLQDNQRHSELSELSEV